MWRSSRWGRLLLIPLSKQGIFCRIDAQEMILGIESRSWKMYWAPVSNSTLGFQIYHTTHDSKDYVLM